VRGAQQLDRYRILREFENFAPLLRVRPEEGGEVVPFQMFPAQREVLRLVADHPRNLVLKSRRLGMTTLFLGVGVHAINTRTGCNALMTAHRDVDATNIFRAADLMDRELPEQIRHQRGRAQRREIEYPLMGSRLQVGTAGGAGAGRSDSLQYVHMTEVSRYKGDVGSFISGVLEAARAGQVIGESTGYGASGWFYDTWMDNREGGPWQCIFVPWWADPRNLVELTDAEAAGFAYEESEAWARQAKLTPQQVVWYRNKAATLPGRVHRMEYPPDDLTAFASSGRHFFDQELIVRLQAQVKRTRRWFDRSNGDRSTLPSKLRPAAPGCIVWQPPQEGVRYVMGADPADGTPHGDYSHAILLRKDDGREVARIRWRWPPKEFAAYCAALGRWYNKALIVGELNRREFVRNLKKVERYRPLFYRRNAKGVKHAEPGWWMDGQNRPMMLDYQRDAVEGTGDEPGWHIPLDPEWYTECTTFEDQGGGRYEHNPGKHDDGTIARGLALQARLQPGARIRSVGGSDED